MTPSNDPALARARAEALLRAGDDNGALQLLRTHLADPGCALRLREWASAERRPDLLLPALATLEAGNDAVEANVSRAIRLQLQGDAQAALTCLQPLLVAQPDLATVQHHAGRALHNLGRRAQALAALQRAVQLQPDYAEAWYSLGHALRAGGRLDEAVVAYRACLQRTPALRAALLNLGITLNAADRAEEALEPLQRLLQLDPSAVDAWINRGLALHVLGRIVEARESHARALALAPEHPLAHFYLGCLYNEQLQSDAAREHLLAALRGNPDDPDVLTELAGLAEQNNEMDAAADYVRRGLALAPGHPGLTLEATRLARRAGRIDEARARLIATAAAQLPQRLAQQYWFERALVHDRAGEAEAAMQALQQGHALAELSPRRRAIDREAFPRRVQQLHDWLARGAAGALPQPQDPAWPFPFRPAFLVGFPRSGTTLLDTMLDIHPQVVSIEEQPTLETVSDLLLDARGGYPGGLAQLAPEDLARGHRLYREAVQRWVPEGFDGVLLDKLPFRLLRVPLILRLWPQAPILFAQRHPCDVVLSNVMQQFRPNEAFVHFDTIEHAARMYDQVMSAWRQALEILPLRVQPVRYEALVQSPETVLAQACAALGIELQAQMLDSARRVQGRGRIQTNSYQQVAEPIYRRAAGRWQQYRRWLEPVLPTLAPHVEWMGYSLDPD